MKKCIIHIKDEINVKLEGLDVVLRRTLEKKLKFFQPHAYHTPAYKLGRWDGCVSFCSIGGATYLNLLDRLLPFIVDDGYSIEIKDDRTAHEFVFPEITDAFHGSTVWPVGHVDAGKPVMLRDYQVTAIQEFIKNPQCLQEISTGAGKTLMTATMSKLVEPYGRSIVIVPNKDLVRQTVADYENLGLDVGVYFGDKKEIGKTHTICTWQSLNSMEKRFKEGLSELSLAEFGEGMVAVIVDEVHQAKADVLQKLLSGAFANVPIRWGLTGTIPKEEYEQVGIFATLGVVVNTLAASDLQEQGVLANCDVNVVQLADDVEYKTYQEELSYLTTNQKRINYLSNMFAKISESGNTLILVDRVKCGEMIAEAIPGSVFVSGATKSTDRKDEYDEIKTASNKIIIATYGVAAVGINIPRIFNLVMVESGKSFTRVIQSIGRGIRKAHDKDSVQIWDITSNAKFAKKHLTVRKKYYADAKYPYTINKIKWK